MKKIIYGFGLFILAISTSFSQQKLTVDQSKSTITYSMNHPLHAWTGESKQVNSILLVNNDVVKQVAANVKVSTFDSKNANRDSHMIEITEALKFPFVTFDSENIVDNGNSVTITGNLTFHGIKKQISFTAIKKITANHIVLNGNFNILMSQYNVQNPSLMGINTDDKIDFKFNLYYKK